MSENKRGFDSDWVDPEDAPEWSDEQFARAEVRIGKKLIRPATGTLTKAGRPPKGAKAKTQVTLRLDPEIVDCFRAAGPGWQSRINEALRKAAGL
jgi:uncharacterized protein (DUF4415 family)